MQQVDADDAERLLLQRRLAVEHPDVQDDLAGLVVRVRLELHTHPAVALVAAAIAAGHHGVGEREERRVVAALVAEPVQVELELVVEHRLEPAHRDVAVGLAVDRVADGHVVGRDRLGHRPGRAPARKNQRATSWPAPISAIVPYHRGSRLIRSAFCRVSAPASIGPLLFRCRPGEAASLVRELRGSSQVNVGPGGGGTAARSASVAARRRRNSSRRLSSPRAIAQRWLAANTGLSNQGSRRSSGLAALTRQS